MTRLNVLPRRAPGWVGVVCQDERMAVWLVRAIVVENIHARHEDQLLLLPAGPHYQLAKEIKNVVTAVAKTCHYWTYHMPDAQRQAAARLPDELLAPCLPEQAAHAAEPLRLAMTAIEEGIECATELRRVASPYPGWVGLDCKSVEASVWLMRTVMVENILVRREDTVLYVPASPHFAAAQGQRIVAAVVQAWRLWQWHGESHVSSSDTASAKPPSGTE